jgi:hypothetical protein
MRRLDPFAPRQACPESSEGSAMVRRAVPLKRSRCCSRAASTRACVVPVPRPEQERRFTQSFVRELFVRLLQAASTPGHLDVDVGPFGEWAWSSRGPDDSSDPGRVRLVAADHAQVAGALFDRVAIVSAGAGILANRHFSLALRSPRVWTVIVFVKSRHCEWRRACQQRHHKRSVAIPFSAVVELESRPSSTSHDSPSTVTQ